MQRKITKFLIPLPLLLTLPLWPGCSEEPSSVGIGLLSSQDLIQLDTTEITAATGTSIRKHINTGLSANLLVGKVLGYEARALLKFSPIPDTLKTVTVLSANLILNPGYRFGSPENVLAFTVHKMTQGWTQTGVTWDSIATNSYESTVRGTFTRVVADSDSVAVSLDTSMVRNWLQVAGTEAIHGVILVPTAASNTILGFRSFQSDNIPRLVVVYSKNGVQSTITLSAGQDAYVADIENLATDPGLLYVQAGVAYHSILRFDFSQVPEHAGIHRATLELTLNRATSRLNSQSVDSVIAFFLSTGDSISLGSGVFGFRQDSILDVYTFRITSNVQRWVNGRANFGLQIEAFAVSTTLDLFTFFSPSADATLRPRLKVFYSRLL